MNFIKIQFLMTLAFVLCYNVCFSQDKSTEPSFMKAAIITGESIEDGYRSKNRSFQGIPSIEVGKGGRLWAVWFGGGFGEGDENYVVLATSADSGESWSQEKVIIDYPTPDYPSKLRAFDPSIWFDSTGKLWVFWAQSYGWNDGRAGVWAITTKNSVSDNPDWSQPRRLCDGVMINKPTVLSCGSWILPVAQWSPEHKKNFRYHPSVPKDRYLSNVYISHDKGNTWYWQGGADVPKRDHDEHTVIERKDGSLWVLVRTQYGYGESFSVDKGKSWSEGKPASFENPTARIFIGRLNSGKLLLIKNGELDKRTERVSMTAYLSDDDGESWYGGLVIDERPDVSYPNASQASDGTIYAIYDRSRYKEKEILMARFSEKDVEAGKCVSKNSLLKGIVNKSSGEPAKVIISPEGGSYDDELTVKLSYPIHGPWIYYTTDGTTPTHKSEHYKEPIVISENTVIKAKAIGGGGKLQSPVSTIEYKFDKKQ